MKTFKKAFAVIMCVVLTLTAAPLGGFVGLDLPSLFDFRAEAVTYSGACGDNLTWSLNTNTGILNITGTGAMYNYSTSNLPWGGFGYKFQSAVIDDGATNIGNYAFYNCTNLTVIEIPASVTSIGNDAFYGCSKLADIHFDGYEDDWNDITVGNGNNSVHDAKKHYKHKHIVNTVEEKADPTCTEDGYITGICECGERVTQMIPACHDWSENDNICARCHLACDHTYNIGTACKFCGKTILVNGTFGADLTWICDFRTKTLTISGSGSMMNECPWEKYKDSIQCVVIEKGVTDIGVRSFGAFHNLISVTIPDSVKTIDYAAFTDCPALSDVYYDGTDADWNSISIGDGNNDLLNATHHYNNEGVCGDNITWFYDTETRCLTISGTGEMYDFSEDNQPWVAYRDDMRSAVISEGVTSVGDYTFEFYRYIRKITLPDTIATIGKYAFHACYGISSIVIPDNVTIIEDNAFSYCTGILSLEIPDGVTSIGDHAFDYCIALKSITIPESVKSIGNAAFQYCQRLESITLPSGITTIGYSMFRNCEVLERIEIPAGVTSIGSYAFGDCYKLSEIVLPETLPEISEGMFYNCDDITELRIPDGATSIGNSAFSGCTNLRSITIPGSVKLIDEEAFACYSLKDVYFLGTESQWNEIEIYASYNDPLFNATRHYLDTSTCGDNLTWSYDSSTQILRISGSGAMYDYSSGSCPWENYKALIQTVIIEDGVTSISNYAFDGCENLKTVYYNGTKSGWDSILVGNGNNPLLNATRHYAVTGVCGDNLTWEYNFETKALTVSGTGKMYIFSVEKNPWESYKNEIQSVVIGDGVTSIGGSAFSQCTELVSVDLPNSLTYIDGGAFRGCSKLKNIVIPGSVKIIGSSAFSGCTNLEEATLLYGVQEISAYAFYNCKNLRSIKIPHSLTKIGSDAFYGCTSLADVYYGGTAEKLNKIISSTSPIKSATIHYVPYGICGSEVNWSYDLETKAMTISGTGAMYDYDFNNRPWEEYEDEIESVIISDGVTSVGDHAFDDCDKITIVTIGSDVTTIGIFAFNSCDVLAKAIIGDSVTSIGMAAFQSTQYLTDVILPESLTSIDDYAFYYCNKLTDIYYKGSQAQWTGISIAAHNDPLQRVTVHYSYVHIPIVPANGAVADNENGIIYGLDAGVDSLNNYIIFEDERLEWSYDEGVYGFGTGTVATLKDGSKTIAEYTVVIFGDIDGNGWYDANDAFLVRMIANGMIDKSVLNEAQQKAADCNHDGEINELDFEILNNASLLIENIDQSATKAELATNSVYIEYMSLIDQSAGLETEEETPSPETNAPEAEINIESFFAMIFDILKQILKFVLSLATK